MTRVKELREQLQKEFPALFTQEALARRIGVTVSAYTRWEAGTRRPRRHHAKALARELRVSVEDLGFEDGP